MKQKLKPLNKRVNRLIVHSQRLINTTGQNLGKGVTAFKHKKPS